MSATYDPLIGLHENLLTNGFTHHSTKVYGKREIRRGDEVLGLMDDLECENWLKARVCAGMAAE